MQQPLASVLIILGLALGACARSGDSAKEQEERDKGRAGDVRIDELLTAYRADEARADQQYKGKWIVVQGGQADEVRSSYLTVGTGKFLEIPMVQCMLKADHVGKAASAGKGRRVSVRGKVHGLLLNVLLDDCEIM